MKLMIAVGVTPDGEMPPGIGALVAAATDILVMSPSIVGPLRWLAGGVDARAASRG